MQLGENCLINSDVPEDLRCLKPESLEDLLQILICPDCRGELSVEDSSYRCLRCGRNFPVSGKLVMLLPSNLEEEKKHEDGYYESHRLEGKGKPAWMTLALKREDIQFLKEVFLPRHKCRIKGRFLEIGSGSCWASSLIQKSYCSRLERTIASDVSSVALQKGVEISQSMQANINYFINCDTERLPFKDGSFDVIFGSAIIHHFPNTEKGVSEIHRVLREGGVYLGINETVTSSVFTLFSNSRLWHVRGRAKERGITEKVFGYSEWIKLFSQAGFKDVRVDLERDSKYKLRTSARTRTRWIMPIYYQVLSFLPDSLVRKYLASSISIVARK
jgi:ubiquinone/menaquinone biosynthesis C-methylase UbiE/uncharacterized protein YbaR (Trm112 family)